MRRLPVQTAYFAERKNLEDAILFRRNKCFCDAADFFFCVKADNLIVLA